MRSRSAIGRPPALPVPEPADRDAGEALLVRLERLLLALGDQQRHGRIGEGRARGRRDVEPGRRARALVVADRVALAVADRREELAPDELVRRAAAGCHARRRRRGRRGRAGPGRRAGRSAAAADRRAPACRGRPRRSSRRTRPDFRRSSTASGWSESGPRVTRRLARGPARPRVTRAVPFVAPVTAPAVDADTRRGSPPTASARAKSSSR